MRHPKQRLNDRRTNGSNSISHSSSLILCCHALLYAFLTSGLHGRIANFEQVGKILHPEIFGSTMGWTLRLLQGDPTAFFKFPERMYHLIDLRVMEADCFRMVRRRGRCCSPLRDKSAEPYRELRANIRLFRATDLGRRRGYLPRAKPGKQADPGCSTASSRSYRA